MIRNRKLLGRGALLAIALLFVGLTMLSTYALRGWRLDFTENRLYTIAPGTERILDGLAEPVNLYFYWSAKTAGQFPQLKAYGTRVAEFLQELEARAGGNLRLSIIDPLPFSEDEDRAAQYGIRPVPLGASGEQLYFGLAGTNSTDGQQVIELFDPGKEEFLEYDIAKLIQQLSAAEKPVVGWLSSLPMGGGVDPMTGQPSRPWLVLAQAEQLFDVRQLEPSMTAIGTEIDVLVIVHPKRLPPAALQAIDQFALRGGRIALFLDPLAEQDPAGADPSNPYAAALADRSSQLEPLLDAWGVTFNPREALGDLGYGLSVSTRAADAPTRHIGILGLDATAMNGGDVITSALTSVNLASTGYLQARAGATTRFEPLLESSTLAAPLPAERLAMLTDPATLQDGFRPTGQRYALAARVTGAIRSAYAQASPAPALEASVEPLNLVVFADTDLLSDYLWVRQQNVFGQSVSQAWANNGDLVWNTLDNLAGSNDLISVRGRATFSRPFDRVDELRRQAEGRFRAKEQELEAALAATEEKLTALESRTSDSAGMMLTPQQEQELERFQEEKLRIRKELRDVRLGLEQEIRTLGNELKLANIVYMPAALAGVALLVALWRRKRHAAILLVQKSGRK